MRPAGVPQRSSSPLARSRTRSCCARPWPPPRARPCGQAARPERVIADKGYPSKANRAWLREHGIKATIPEWDDQIAHRRREPGRPIDFGRRQQERYRGRNVVELSVSKLKRWRGTAVRSDRTARNYHDALCLASTLHWLNTSFSNTARPARRDSMGRPSLWQGCDHVLVPDDALTCRTPGGGA